MRRSPRSGFVIGLVVFASLTVLALAIYPMLFASGSGVRTEALSLTRWRARAVAVSGLKAAASVLRVGKPYGGGDVCADTESDVEPFLRGQQTSADLGIDESEGRFLVFYDTALSQRRVTPGACGGQGALGMHHVDVYVRGWNGDDSAVAYGAFLTFPTAYALGTSTDAAPGSLTPSVTTKRLVRVHTILDPDLQDVTQLSVRQAIRARLDALGSEYLQNYARIDFDAAPSPLGQGVGDAAAEGFLQSFLRSPPAGSDPEAIFARDRFYDVLFEGTPPEEREEAWRTRYLQADLPPCTGPEAATAISLAEDFCGRVADCEWVEPLCLDPSQITLESEDSPGPTAIERQHQEQGGDPDAGYMDRIQRSGPVLRSYTFGCEETFLPDTPPEDMPADVFSFVTPSGEERFCAGVYATISEPERPVPWNLVEPSWDPDAPPGAVGAGGSVFELLEFFRRFHSLEEGLPFEQAVTVNLIEDDPAGGGGDDGEDGEDGDDGGDDGGGGTSDGGGGTSDGGGDDDGGDDDGGDDGGGSGGSGGGAFGGSF